MLQIFLLSEVLLSLSDASSGVGRNVTPNVSFMDFCPVILPSLASSQMDSGLDLKILGSAFLAGELV